MSLQRLQECDQCLTVVGSELQPKLVTFDLPLTCGWKVR